MNDLTPYKTDTLIIGAGICGLTLAHKLNHSSLILEKSQGVGGRIANRRIQDLGFDHGAPYLKDDPLLRELLEEHLLHEDMGEDTEGTYLKNSMTRLPKKLATNLLIKKCSKGELIFRSNDSWTVVTDRQEEYTGKNLILTAPLPQSLDLLSKSHIEFPKELKNINYTKALMALLILKQDIKPNLSHSKNIHSVLAMKERGLHPRGFVIRGTPEFSDLFFEEKEEDVLHKIINDFMKGFSISVELEHQELKKWRYVTPYTALPCPYIEVAPSLFVTGDAFLFPDVRGALHGATQLAKKLNLS